jgi:hypothetical protein
MYKTKIVVVLAMTLLIVAFLTANAAAGSNGLPLTWVFSPDSDTVNTDQPESVYWTNSNVEIGIPTDEDAGGPLGIYTQVSGIYGVGALLPTDEHDAFTIELDWVFKTWDSYNPNVDAHTGYWDSWSATITEGGYYWQESLTDPIDTDVDIVHIFVLEGGTSYDDGQEETYVNPGAPFTDSFGWVVPGPGDYYLNLVLDTLTAADHNGFYPSHGEWSHVTVTPAPAAVILGILGLGVAGLKLRKYA